jgi:hypothetical protein
LYSLVRLFVSEMHEYQLQERKFDPKLFGLREDFRLTDFTRLKG